MTPRTQTPLSYPDWLKKNHAPLTGARKFYKGIGVYDLLYLFYRLTTPTKKVEEPTHEHPAVRRAMRKTAGKEGSVGKVGKEGKVSKEGPVGPEGPVNKEGKEEMQPSQQQGCHPEPMSKDAPAGAKEKGKKKTQRTKKTKRAQRTETITKNITMKTIEKKEELDSPKTSSSSDSSESSESSVSSSSLLWLTAKELEDVEDLRKTDYNLGVGNIPVSFSKRSIDDEEETQLHVGDKIFRVLLPSPALNLSRMAQTVKVSYGELYVLGRAALGAISGEGYISAKEAERLVQELHETDERSFTLGVSYANKDATSSSRMESVVTLRFERTDR